MTEATRTASPRLFVRWNRLGPSTQIIIGLALGILAGLFFGEPAAALQPLADVYIRLMQMTVLPYLVLTLVIGLGRMEAAEAKRLAARGSLLLVLFWALTLAVVGLTPLAFPVLESASFFSTSLLEPHQPLALQEIYVPSNPFHAMANAVVPAVVLFSCALGVALIGIENKGTLLANLRILEQAVVRVTRFVISLTPLGVFAIAAVAAGTLDLETLERLEVYLVSFAVAALLLTFVVLPLTVAALTPFKYRDVVSAARDALLTAFVANSVFIVLPILVERAKGLIERNGVRNPDADSAIEVLVPLAFTFPNAGRLLTLLFVPYAAWLSGSPLEAGGYGVLFAAGLPAYFAKAQVALPFLLDLVGVPHDHFQLYIPTTIVTGKFDSMVSAMAVLAFALVGAAAMTGFLRVAPMRILATAGIVLAALVGSIAGTGALLAAMTDTSYRKGEALQRMQASGAQSNAIVHKDQASVRPDPPGSSVPALERIRARGTLRVGFDPGNPPFSFFNASGELVGLDVELAQGLAEALGVQAEFVPIAWQQLSAALAGNLIDVMPGVWYRPFWFASVRLSEPYHIGTMAIVVRDERRHEFASIADLRRSRGLRIGVPLDTSQVRASITHYFADADVEYVPLETTVPFFEGRQPELDAVLMPAESGSAATLLHPQYSVVVPEPAPIRIPTAFGAALHSGDLVNAINEWIVFAKSEGSIQRRYDYWVLGKGAEKPVRRWSILRDVLGVGR
jgi:Na+/H+-dicarboxylate symporter/ABC-type amino acid transport substrate-binding protein